MRGLYVLKLGAAFVVGLMVLPTAYSLFRDSKSKRIDWFEFSFMMTSWKRKVVNSFESSYAYLSGLLKPKDQVIEV